ncbi:hypothetical protein BGX26_003523, partial [Mortierella sp. AD094]
MFESGNSVAPTNLSSDSNGFTDIKGNSSNDDSSSSGSSGNGSSNNGGSRIGTSTHLQHPLSSIPNDVV